MIRRLVFSVLALTLIMGFHPVNNPSTTSTSDLGTLTAVLIVGYQEDGTQNAMDKMDEIAGFLRGKGITVYRYYNIDAQWEDIKATAKRASFLVYSGHGSSMGEDGKVGGLVIRQYVTSKMIMEELQLRNNAMVLFQSVCNGAGSSASDDGDIGITEALTRVSDYSYPFFKTGAACYYANNLNDGCLKFLRNFFEGKDLKTCFTESANFWAEIEMENSYKYDNKKKISVASTDWGGTVTRTSYVNGEKTVTKIPASKDYSIAYVGSPKFSIRDVVGK